MALTAAPANHLLAIRGKFKVTTDPVPLTEQELTQMRLKLDGVLARLGRLGEPDPATDSP